MLGVEPGDRVLAMLALMANARDQFRRDRRAEPQLCGAQPRQSRLDPQRRPGVAAARRGAAGPRQDARQSRARPRPGPVRAPAAARPRLAGRARHDDRRGRSDPRRERAFRLGDVGRQCRDRLPRARHRRRPLPPHRRQSADDAAPQPRMAGDAGPAAARLRRRGAFRRARARSRRRSATKARPITCGWPARTARRASRCSSTASAAAPSRPASISKRRGRSPGSTGSIPSAPCSSQQSEAAIAAGAFHNDVVAVANGPCCSRTSRPSPIATSSSTQCAARLPGFEIVEVPTPRSRSPTRSGPICSTPSWSPRPTAR